MRAPLARVEAGSPDRPTLVLVHGITAAALSQADAIEHWVEAGFRVLALDLRGHGLSPRWSNEELARASEVLVEDVVSVLADDLATRRARHRAGLPASTAPAILIGHSLGAAIAMVAGLRHPDLVAGLVLIDPARYGQRTEEELLRRGQARVRSRERTVADLAGAVSRTVSDGMTPASEALPSVWASERSDPAFLATGVVAPHVLWEEAMAGLEVPTLVVTGDRPGSARVGSSGLAYIESLGHDWLDGAVVPGAGHDVRRSRRQGFYAVVDRWLARLSAHECA